MATWTEFLAQVRRELEEDTENTWEDEAILEWANDASKNIALKTLAWEDEQYANSVADQQGYELPPYTINPISVYYNGERLERETYRTWNEADDIAATGTPTHYAVSGDAIYLRPIPFEAQEIRFFRTYYPTPIADVAATTDMPYEDRYNEIIRAYVKARAMEQIREYDSATYYDNLYRNSLMEATHQAYRDEAEDDFTPPQEVW